MKPRAMFFAVVLLLPVPAFARGDNDRFELGRSITIAAGETVDGDVACLGCSVAVLGKVTGDVAVIGGSLSLDGEVAKDVSVVGGSARLGPNSRIGHDLAVIGGGLQRDATATVGGQVSGIGHGAGITGLGAITGIVFISSLVLLLPLSIVLALLCYLVAGQRRLDNVVGILRARTGLSFLAGIGVVIAAIALSALFSHFRPVAGLLVLAVWIAVMLASILGYTALSALVGRKISATAGPIAILVIGALVIALLQAIPLVGAFALFIFSCFALGSAVLSGYGTEANWMERRMGPRTPAI